MRRLALLLAALAAVGPAAAAPVTDAFEGLKVEFAAREGSLPGSGGTPEQRRQRSAILKCFRALERDSVDLGDDIKMAGKIAKVLAGAFPGDPTFGPLVDGALDDLEDLLREDRDTLAVAISLLAGDRFRDAAQRGLDAADGALADAAAAATAALRARALGRAEAAVGKGSAAAAKGSPGGATGESAMAATVAGLPWAANSTFGTAVGGLVTVSEAGGVRRIVLRGRRILPNGDTPPLPDSTSTLDLSIDAVTADIVAGTYPVGNVGGYSTDAIFTNEDADGDLDYAYATSGTVVIGSLQVALGSVTITGTFSFTMRDATTGATFSVAAGTFEAQEIPRTAGEP